MSHFSERLTKLRTERKKENSSWTQGYVAEKIGVARVTYTAYERGTKTPPIETVTLIAKLFDVSTDYFLADLPISEKSLFGVGVNEHSASYDTNNSGMAFYGGGRDWTEEEIEMAEAVIEAHRARKKQKEEEAKKRK